MAQAVAIPGQPLGPASQYHAGPGTHIHEAHLYSSLLGTVSVVQPEKTTEKKTQAAAPPSGPVKRMTRITPLPQQQEESNAKKLPTMSVSRSGLSEKREVLPEVGNVVLCRVTRISPRQATVAILVVGDTVLEGEWQGLIRVQDVRATEKDRVKIYESFRPGDIVRAQVVSCTTPPPCIALMTHASMNPCIEELS